jgi:hypothetical protein
MKLRFLLFVMIVVWSCSKEQVSGNPINHIRILFVGNSLTYTNDIPALIKELGNLDNIRIDYTTIAFGNYGLDDHLSEGIVQSTIQKGKYDIVVVQQGPSALPASQSNLMSAVSQFKRLCDEAKTKLAVYMVWPSKDRLFDLDNVIYSYSNAAKKNNALVCAAGLAWKKTWATAPNISLYGPDGFHPDLTGSLLSAMVIYGTLTGKYTFSEVKADNKIWSGLLDAKTLDILKQTAKEAIETKW